MRALRNNGDPGTAAVRQLAPTEGECEVEGCRAPIKARRWCGPHYDNWRLRGAALKSGPGQGRRPPKYTNTVCLIDGCDRPKGPGRGWCTMHYQRWQATRDVGSVKPLRSDKGNVDWIDAGGYRQVSHPVTKKRVLEHRLIMEQVIGRNLLSGENVHHRNGVRVDNRPENLELWVGRGSQPSGQRVVDLVAWAKGIVETYDAIAQQEILRLS